MITGSSSFGYEYVSCGTVMRDASTGIEGGDVWTTMNFNLHR